MLQASHFAHIEFLDETATNLYLPLLDRNGIWKFNITDVPVTLLLRITAILDDPFYVVICQDGWRRALLFLNHNCTQSEVRIDITTHRGTIEIQLNPAILKKCCYKKWVKGPCCDTIRCAYEQTESEALVRTDLR